MLKEGQLVKAIPLEGGQVLCRYPRWQDIPSYVEMCQILHRERVRAYHADTDFALGCQRLAQIMVEVETGQASHLLLEVDGRIIGEGRMAPHNRVMGILGIKIIGEYQGRHLGTALMGVLEEEARKMELQQIYLTVFANNTPARRLYEKVGYRQVGRIAEWFSEEDEDGHIALVDRIDMVKRIEPETRE